jgi:hypothetical protein
MLTVNRKQNTIWINDDVNVSILKDLNGKYIKVNVWDDVCLSTDHFFRCPVEASEYVTNLVPNQNELLDTYNAISEILSNC